MSIEKQVPAKTQRRKEINSDKASPRQRGEIIMNDQQPEKAEWKWRYSPWTGIMYGPVPVGIIVVAILFIVYFVFFA